MDYIKQIRKSIGHQRMIHPAVGIIIENEREEILLQLRSDTKDYGTPGGYMELDETITATLVREIKEETNLELNLKDISLFGIYSGEKCVTIYPNQDEIQAVIFMFYCKVNGEIQPIKDDESIELRFFSRRNLPKNIKTSDKLWIQKWYLANFELEIN